MTAKATIFFIFLISVSQTMNPPSDIDYLSTTIDLSSTDSTTTEVQNSNPSKLPFLPKQSSQSTITQSQALSCLKALQIAKSKFTDLTSDLNICKSQIQKNSEFDFANFCGCESLNERNKALNEKLTSCENSKENRIQNEQGFDFLLANYNQTSLANSKSPENLEFLKMENQRLSQENERLKRLEEIYKNATNLPTNSGKNASDSKENSARNNNPNTATGKENPADNSNCQSLKTVNAKLFEDNKTFFTENKRLETENGQLQSKFSLLKSQIENSKKAFENFQKINARQIENITGLENLNKEYADKISVLEANQAKIEKFKEQVSKFKEIITTISKQVQSLKTENADCLGKLQAQALITKSKSSQVQNGVQSPNKIPGKTNTGISGQQRDNDFLSDFPEFDMTDQNKFVQTYIGNSINSDLD